LGQIASILALVARSISIISEHLRWGQPLAMSRLPQPLPGGMGGEE
jgi:hypothetical protein